jgi:hypothetical protein
MEIQISNLQKIAGEGSSFVETQKSIDKREKQQFLDLIENLNYIDDRSLEVESMGLDLTSYEEAYMSVIEHLVIKTYGFKCADIIFWWIGDRKAIKAKTYNLIDDDGTINVVSNVNQLYKLILKLK